MEKPIIASGIYRPIIHRTVIFGIEDILINTIAWRLRRFLLFVVPGQGNYRFQSILVEGLAEIALDPCEEKDNLISDDAGPANVGMTTLSGWLGMH